MEKYILTLFALVLLKQNSSAFQSIYKLTNHKAAFAFCERKELALDKSLYDINAKPTTFLLVKKDTTTNSLIRNINFRKPYRKFQIFTGTGCGLLLYSIVPITFGVRWLQGKNLIPINHPVFGPAVMVFIGGIGVLAAVGGVGLLATGIAFKIKSNRVKRTLLSCSPIITSGNSFVTSSNNVNLGLSLRF